MSSAVWETRRRLVDKHRSHILDSFHTKQYFHQNTSVVCIDVAINHLLPVKWELSPVSTWRSERYLRSQRVESLIQFEHPTWYSPILDVCFVFLQENLINPSRRTLVQLKSEMHNKFFTVLNKWWTWGLRERKKKKKNYKKRSLDTDILYCPFYTWLNISNSHLIKQSAFLIWPHDHTLIMD